MKPLKLIFALCTGFLLSMIAVTGYAAAKEIVLDQADTLIYSVGLTVVPYAVAGITLWMKIPIGDGMRNALFVNYTATTLLEARDAIEASLAGKINQNELRIPKMGAIDAFVQSTPSMIAGGAEYLRALKMSSAQPTKIDILKDLSSSIDTARNCGATTEGDSAQLALTYVTRSKGFRMSELLFAGNDARYQTVFNHNLARCIRYLHGQLDADCISTLETNKSAVNHGTLNPFNAVLDQMECTHANENSFWGNAYAELMQNNFTGPYFNVHSLAQIARWNFLMNQGAGNAVNEQYQLSDFKNFPSAGFTTPSGGKDASYFFVPGTVGMIDWTNALSRAGANIGTDEWTTFPDPLYPITWELKIKRSCVDRSSVTTGGEADLVTEFRLTAEFAYVNAYTSNTDTGIYKYVQMT